MSDLIKVVILAVIIGVSYTHAALYEPDEAAIFFEEVEKQGWTFERTPPMLHGVNGIVMIPTVAPPYYVIKRTWNEVILVDCRPTSVRRIMPPRIVTDGIRRLIIQRDGCHTA